MKRVKWFLLCIILILGAVYIFRDRNPAYGLGVGWSTAGSGPSAAFRDNLFAVGKEIVVITEDFPWGTSFSYEWKVDGEPIENDSERYTPTKEDLEKFISVTVKTNHEEIEPLEIKVFFSRLPVFYIDIENGEYVTSKTEYLNGTLTIQGNERYYSPEILYSGEIQIKGRGNSTWKGTDKKSYHLKLKKNADLFGMGSENDWTMLANPFDETLMRNATAYNLSGQLGLDYMESTWVDVVVNGTYVGNYQLCEKIEASSERIDIMDWEALASEGAKLLVKTGSVAEKDREELKVQMRQDLSWLTTGQVIFQDKAYDLSPVLSIPPRTGGFIMELDMFYDEVSQFMVENQPFMFQEPQYAVTNPKLFEYVKNYVTAFFNAVMHSEDFCVWYEEEERHYTDFFDRESLAAFFLIQEIYFNEDSNAKSTYFYKDIDELAHMGPVWDMDWSSGGEGLNAALYDEWQTLFYSNYSQNNHWYKGLVKDPYFLSVAKECWDTHHEEIFNLVSENGMIDQMYEYLYESGVANNALWSRRGMGFEEEVELFRTWMINRLGWLEQQFASLKTLVDSIGGFEYGGRVELEYANRIVSVQTEASEGVYARLYVNGRRYAEEVLREGAASWALEESLFTKPSDVLQVRVYDENDVQIGSNYIDYRSQQE